MEAENKIPQITIDSSSDASKADQLPEEDPAGKEGLLVTDSDILLKQRRSKSDSSFTPGLIPPKIHMETYSTEELHPSTTLLSLSSVTNTVRLRQVYARTKVESHLICPTVFQPSTNVVIKKGTVTTNVVIEERTGVTEESCSSQNDSDTNNIVAQCSVNVSCSDGCGTPPDKSPTLHILNPKQRSQSLMNGSDELKHCSRLLQNRRASDFDCYVYNNVYDTSTDNISNRSPSEESRTRHSPGSPHTCSNKECLKGIDDSDSQTPSWSWHISRSFSAERPVKPTHDFDLPSVHGSSSSLNYNGRNRRRGSAPVTYSLNKDCSIGHISSVEDLQCKDSLREGLDVNGSSGRRWSIPMVISGNVSHNYSFIF